MASSSAGTSAKAAFALQAITVVAITGFLIYLIVLIGFDNKNVPVVSTCPVGQCPAGLFVPYKDCSRSEYDPSRERCMPEGFCTGQTPCAIQASGESLCPGVPNGGVCPSGVACACSAYQLCPDEIRSFFVPQNFNGQNYFEQNAAYVNVVNQFRWDPPLNAGYPAQNRFCFLDASSLGRVTNKKCLEGTLTLYPAQSGTIDRYGCVGLPAPCPIGQHPVWDYASAAAVCRTVPTWPAWRE